MFASLAVPCSCLQSEDNLIWFHLKHKYESCRIGNIKNQTKSQLYLGSSTPQTDGKFVLSSKL